MILRVIKYQSKDWERAVRLREQILRLPLGSKFTLEELNEEKDHIHIAGFVDHELIATSVLVPEKDAMKMQRVVVQEEYRNRSIGAQMIEYCEGIALEHGYITIYCHARDTAVNFYLQNKYESEGDYFDEDGIPHLKMIKKLSRPA